MCNSYALTYDQGSNTVGNLTGVTEWDGSTALFGYDALSRLTAEQRTGTAAESHSYGYDPAGNMTSKDGSTTNLSYDAANKLSTTSVFSYDKDGDMTSSSPSGSSYGWDDRGNMVSRTVSGQVSYAYGYNAMGLRVHSVITPGGQPTVNTFYVYDGDTLLGEVSSTGTVNAVYTWGADGLASERLLPATTAKSLFYAFGPQGETRQLTNSTGQVVDSYAYTAWGQALSSTGSDANPFQHGGKDGYYSEYNGAVLCGHRWYDTNTLRWLSRDPIGYGGGHNLYIYCDDDPLNGVDPSGKQAEPVEPFKPGRSPAFSDEFENEIEILRLAGEIKDAEDAEARENSGTGAVLALRARLDEIEELNEAIARNRSRRAPVKAARLPQQGGYRFIPQDRWQPPNKLPRGARGGYLDKFGNEWCSGPGHPNHNFKDILDPEGNPYPYEWDVYHKDGTYSNVSYTGVLRGTKQAH